MRGDAHQQPVDVVRVLVVDAVGVALIPLAELVQLCDDEGGRSGDSDRERAAVAVSSAVISMGAWSTIAASSPEARRVARLECGGMRPPRRPPGSDMVAGTEESRRRAIRGCRGAPPLLARDADEHANTLGARRRSRNRGRRTRTSPLRRARDPDRSSVDGRRGIRTPRSTVRSPAERCVAHGGARREKHQRLGVDRRAPLA
jgi:hypothetical protein